MLKIRLRPWVRRMFTRALAIVPAAVVAGVYGAAGAGRLLVFSQARLHISPHMCLLRVGDSRALACGWLRACHERVLM